MNPSDPPAASQSNAGIPKYRGRLAPSPTGFLHLGHARTFWIAQQRAHKNNGTLILRNEDLDPDRCRPEFDAAMLEDLQWFGFQWQEGPDCGGPFGPYRQSERFPLYRAALQKLIALDAVYPCTCSRKDIQSASRAPHPADDELIYPGTCRPAVHSALGKSGIPSTMDIGSPSPGGPRCAKRTSLLGKLTRGGLGKPLGRGEGEHSALHVPHSTFNWRFCVLDGQPITFNDAHFGPQCFIAGKDFGDFIVWRHDDVPAYQLAVVVDDAAMQITEVVRGADLLLSTARQLLLYRTLALAPPAFYHCPLMTDESGTRLAKRHDALSLRTLRTRSVTPETLRQDWGSI